MANHDVNPGQGFHATPEQLAWGEEDEAYWRDNWSSRPYASADRGYAYYQPAYRYGVEAARKYQGKQWRDVEQQLREWWDSYEHRDGRSWDDVQHAARDSWDRARGRR